MLSKQLIDEFVYRYGQFRSLFPALLCRPLGYFLYITGECNLDCSYCWQRHQEDTASVDGWTNTTHNALSTDEWIKVVNALPSKSFLGISGGESTISPSFGPVIEAAAGRLPISVNTNFLSIKDQHIDLLTRSGVRNVSVSLDGFAEVHDWSRQRKGSFDKIVENIHRLHQAKQGREKPTLTIKTVLMNENVDRLIEFREFCSNELKANELNISFEKIDNHFQFSLLHNRDHEKVFKDSAPRLYEYENIDEIYRVLVELLEQNKRSSCDVILYPRMSTKQQIKRFLEARGENVYSPCYLPLSMVTVLPDGEVIPCLSCGLGNVRASNYSVQEVIARDQYKSFWKQLVSSPGLVKACNICCFSKVQ